jgi:hypothetical protein
MRYRDTATTIAQRAPIDYLGIVLADKSGWNAVAFATPEELGAWYASAGAGIGSSYRYVAAIDKTRPTVIVAELSTPEVDDTQAKRVSLGVLGVLGIGGAVLLARGFRDSLTTRRARA